MPKALLIIDYTNDFVADQGALTCGAVGQALQQPIAKLAQDFLLNGDFVYLPTDVHTPNDPYHPETKLFPPHNVLGSWGRELYGAVDTWYQTAKANDHVLLFPKTCYSSFAGTPLDLWLRERHIDELHLVGVCTDICVLHTAVDAYNLNYPMVIHQDAVATFTPGGQEWVLNHFKTVLNATLA